MSIMNPWIQFLKNQVRPALGCTEPVAVALGVAWAKQYSEGELISLNIEVSDAIYKNGFKVTIPGTTETGNRFAGAIAWVSGNPDLGLEVLRDVKEADYEVARALQEKVHINFDSAQHGVYIKVQAKTEKSEVICLILGEHDNVVSIIKDGKIVVSKVIEKEEAIQTNFVIADHSLKEIRQLMEELPKEDIHFLLDGAEMNYAMSVEGLDKGSGAGVGSRIKKLIDANLMENSIMNQVRMSTAAAADGRMGGVNMPVMSSAGSGNHGITATLPVYLLAHYLNKDDETLTRALGISHLVTSYIKAFTGRLSPICGCSIAAGAGAAAGNAWLLGGKDEEIGRAINYMIASLAGMICDGAKAGCASKIATSAEESVLAAYLAQSETEVGEIGGIVSKDPERTIRNLGSVSSSGLNGLDMAILNVLQKGELVKETN